MFKEREESYLLIYLLKAIEALCKKFGSLFIIDEVQTGIGRTGTLFAYEQMGITPHIVTTAKALGNGIPVGAMIGRKELGISFPAGSHGSTFGEIMLQWLRRKKYCK